MSAGTGERARLWPKPVVNQLWADDSDDHETIVIIDVDTEGEYPVSFIWKDGTTGRSERDMRGFEPTTETWLAALAATDAELRRVEGERDYHKKNAADWALSSIDLANELTASQERFRTDRDTLTRELATMRGHLMAVLKNARCDGGESEEHNREECGCDREDGEPCMCAAHVADAYLESTP